MRAEGDLRGAYAAFYRRSWARGEAGVCREEALKGPARRLLLSASAAEGRLGRLRGLLLPGKKGEASDLLRLRRALEFLELLCVNLFLSPWRKEIRALKTFTGRFVYCLGSVLPEAAVERLLGEIGYVATSATQFSLARKLSQEEAEQAAFELFLARIECEDLLETTEEARDGRLGDLLLQKRAQRPQQPGRDLDEKHQRKGHVLVSGQSEAQGGHSPQETYLAHSSLASEGAENTPLRSEVGLRCPTEESSQTAISKCIPEQSMTPQGSSVGVSSNSCIKSSDSEDFLIKYSDIVIGQKPLHLSDLSSKASASETQAVGFVEARLGPPAKGGQSLTFLSPDASGPQALAILNHDALGNGHLYDYGTQESCRDTVESKVCDAIDCLSIHGSDPTDQPKELKGNIAQHSSTNNFPSKKLKIEENCAGQLMYPVEETAQMEQRTTKSGIQVFDHSTPKLANLPSGNREDFNIDLYSSPDLFCNITGCKCPAVDSTYSRLIVGIPVASESEGCFRHVGEQPSSSCTVIPEIPYQGGFPASLQCRRERCALHSSLADFNTCLTPLSETDPEGYVIIDKNE
ncbi:uncharacterized protein LOC121914280 isoform X2 [Sceloporus undulatus]|uniref:uncharacterized protein LOC121914280 isoform X2 n=1 Tax=Sceloporus undulatus TaxID=8520 RepID=UPI001C4DBB46|nr:uncharacterized protein LOC121914280 isoform X2 [Sceloporus undulatus]